MLLFPLKSVLMLQNSVTYSPILGYNGTALISGIPVLASLTISTDVDVDVDVDVKADFQSVEFFERAEIPLFQRVNVALKLNS